MSAQLSAPMSAAGASASAAAPPSTPAKRSSAALDAGSSRRIAVSPAYTNRRTSLYGTEDRVVIDPGARVWKVGFSGEPDPRAAFWAAADVELEEARTGAGEMWDLDLGAVSGARGSRTEARRLVGARIDRKVRDVYHKYLLTDSKARKVLIVENTFLPIFVKEEIARALFENLKVPSVAFTPSSLLTLAACGHVTGLVVDCGWLETTVTPVCYSRPMYHLARSSPLGGRALHSRLRALLRHYGQYRPPSRDSSGSSAAPREGVPLGVLTAHLVERVLSESCFVCQTAPKVLPQPSTDEPAEPLDEIDDAALMSLLSERYHGSQARDWNLAIPVARGPSPTLIVPGWIRERAAEVLFGDGPDEAPSLPELILDTLLKIPVDIRSTLASAIVLTGGMSSLPGMIPRLRGSVLMHLPDDVPETPTTPKPEVAMWKKRMGSKYAALHGLGPSIGVLNDPAPIDGKTTGKGGMTPRWAPPLLPWIGGSLAGVLKTSGPELLREEYDTRVTDSLALGEAYQAQLKAERQNAPIPAHGLALEDLRPGMATGALAEQRKRGWTAGGGLGDWTTTIGS